MRRLLLLAALPALVVAAILVLVPRRPPPSPVLHIRLASVCYVGVTNTPSPCPIDTWIDETSGAVRERQEVQHATMDQIFVPQRDGRWRVADRISDRNDGAAKWSSSSSSSLPLPYPRSLAALRAAMRRLEQQGTVTRVGPVRGHPAVAVTPPETGIALPWPLATADTVYLDRATALPLRIAYLRGPAADVFVDEQSTADLPDGFLSLPGSAHATPLDAVLSFLERLRADLPGH